MATRTPVKRDWEAIIAEKFGKPLSEAEMVERDLQEIWDEYDRLRNWEIPEADDTPRVQALSAQFRQKLIEYTAVVQSGPLQAVLL